MFDASFRVGDVISFLGFFAAGLIAYFRRDANVDKKLDLATQRIGFLEDTVKKETDAQNRKIDTQSIEIGRLGELLIKMGRYEERMLRYDDHILMMKREIDELKHGQGFVNGPRLANAAIP